MIAEFAGLYDMRDYKPEDKNFILATFLRGLYYGDSWFSQIPKDIFMANYKYIAEKLIEDNNTVIKVACLTDDPDVILGYSILGASYQTVHWVYVKANWRKKGIGKSLVPTNLAVATHLSELGRELLTKYKGAIFNPFALN